MSLKKDTAGCWGFRSGARPAGGRSQSGLGVRAAWPFARSVTFALLCAPLSSSVKWASRFPWREEITWGVQKSPVELHRLSQKDHQDSFPMRGGKAS